jgi:hypothetical protein
MYAFVVENQGLPKIRGYTLNLDLVWRNTLLVGYSQEPIQSLMSFNIHLGFTMDISGSWSTLGVPLRILEGSISTWYLLS